MKNKLHLSDEQLDKIEKINNEYEIKLLEFKEKLAPLKIKLERFLLLEKVDLKKIKSILKEIGDLKIEIRLLKIKQRIEIENILNPKQKRELKNKRDREEREPDFD